MKYVLKLLWCWCRDIFTIAAIVVALSLVSLVGATWDAARKEAEKRAPPVPPAVDIITAPKANPAFFHIPVEELTQRNPTLWI